MRTIAACAVVAVLIALFSSHAVAFKADYFIWDRDGNHNAAFAIDRTLMSAGFSGACDTDLPDLATLLGYRTVWICLGVFPYSESLARYSSEITTLSAYLTGNDSTSVYMEGGDAWYTDPWTSFHDYFHLRNWGLGGSGDMGTLVGQSGTFAQGMLYEYSGDNNHMDRLVVDSVSGSFYLFKNDDPQYGVMVAYEDPISTYRTIASSCEFAGLGSGPHPVVVEALAESLMSFFSVPKIVPDRDIALIDISAPMNLTPPTESITPRCVLKNVGTQTAGNFYVYLRINPDGYAESTLVASVRPDSVVNVSFLPNWFPGPPGSQYDIYAYAGWTQDLRNLNDTLQKSVSTWDDRWFVRSSWCYNGESVTADGAIGVSEWANAEARDVSDFLGRSFPQPPGMAKLLVMNDSANLYLGLDAVFDNSNTDFDEWHMYLEDNFDKSWPAYPDSGEGRLKFSNRTSPGPWFEYRPFFSDSFASGYWVTVEGWCDNAVSGHMQYEYIIPLGDTIIGSDTTGRHTCLAADLCDTVGFWMKASDEGQRQVYAWWPTSSNTGEGNLDDMGMIILHCGLERFVELEVVEIVSPPSSAFLGSDYPVTVHVRNNGNYEESFYVYTVVGDTSSLYDYYDSSYVLDLAPNNVFDAELPQWHVTGSETTWTVCAWIADTSDLYQLNNFTCMQLETVRQPGVEELEIGTGPRSYCLFQNFPNPFSKITVIQYAVPKTTRVSLGVFDASGREVRGLLSDVVVPGLHAVRWDGKSGTGEEVPSGVYFLRMRTNSFCSTRKMLLLK